MDTHNLLELILQDINDGSQGKGGGKAYVEMYKQLQSKQDNLRDLLQELDYIRTMALCDLQGGGEACDTSLKRFVLGHKIQFCTRLHTLLQLFLQHDQ